MSAPLFRLVTYDLVRACVTADDKLQALPHLRQCLVFHIRCSLSRCENAEALASFLVPAELSRSSLIFTPRETRAEPSFVRGAFAFCIIKYLPFGRKRKRKRQRGHFPSCPLCKPQNSSYPHKRKARISETSAPLSKEGKKETSTRGQVRYGKGTHQKKRLRQ